MARRANRCLATLNELAGVPEEASPVGRATLGRSCATRHVLAAVQRFGPPPTSCTAAEAFHELRGISGYEEPSSVAIPYDESLVSLPAVGHALGGKWP